MGAFGKVADSAQVKQGQVKAVAAAYLALAAAELKKNGSFKLGGMLNMHMLDQRCDNQCNMSNLKNHEFTFTVDDKELGCGLNGA